MVSRASVCVAVGVRSEVVQPDVGVGILLEVGVVAIVCVVLVFGVGVAVTVHVIVGVVVWCMAVRVEEDSVGDVGAMIVASAARVNAVQETRRFMACSFGNGVRNGRGD